MIKKLTEDMLHKTSEINNCTCSAIISDIIEDYLKLPDIYQQIKEGFLVRNIRKQQWSQVYLSDLLYDRIMLRMSADNDALEFIKKKLGPLVTYDRIHGTRLE